MIVELAPQDNPVHVSVNSHRPIVILVASERWGKLGSDTGATPFGNGWAPRCWWFCVAHVATFPVEVGPLDAFPKTPAPTRRGANVGVTAVNAGEAPKPPLDRRFLRGQAGPFAAEYSVSL